MYGCVKCRRCSDWMNEMLYSGYETDTTEKPHVAMSREPQICN